MANSEQGNSVLVIEAAHADRHYWRDLWRYRELMFFLAWKDVLVRYKQTVIGVVWAVVRPFLTMVVFTVIFGRLANMSSGGVPYPIMVFAALLPWQFFASAMGDASNSLVSNSHLVSKVYFPRIIIPLSAISVSLVDFIASLIVMVCLMAWFHYLPPIQVLALPLFLLLACAIATGGGMLLGALSVTYRDFRLVTPFIIQFGLYLSPVGFSSSVVPVHLRWLYNMNPMVGVIDGFRWCLLGGEHAFQWNSLSYSVLIAMGLITVGVRYFRATEKNFADVI
jgi:lipopolysaccharide transport system permease protein